MGARNNRGAVHRATVGPQASPDGGPEERLAVGKHGALVAQILEHAALDDACDTAKRAEHTLTGQPPLTKNKVWSMEKYPFTSSYYTVVGYSGKLRRGSFFCQYF